MAGEEDVTAGPTAQAAARKLDVISQITGLTPDELLDLLAEYGDSRPAGEPEPDLPPGGQWCVVELLGHRERLGYVTQVERFGTPLLHIDLAAKLWDGDAGAWEEYAGAALYGMHPTTPEEVRAAWEREKERVRRQQEWREREAARWAPLPAGRVEPDTDGAEGEEDDAAEEAEGWGEPPFRPSP